jgi:hypothetical protein
MDREDRGRRSEKMQSDARKLTRRTQRKDEGTEILRGDNDRGRRVGIAASRLLLLIDAAMGAGLGELRLTKTLLYSAANRRNISGGFTADGF